MAQILLQDTSNPTTLPASCVVGRSRACDLRLDEAEVSGRHALLRYTEPGWELRDLGSRNGTFVDDRTILAGERVLLQPGMQIAFGAPARRWRVLSVDPPVAAAIPLDGGPALLARDRILALPDEATPELTLLQGPQGWVIEAGDREEPAQDGQVVEAGGRRFRIALPEAEAGTLPAAERPPCTDALSLRFQVSLDEEFCSIDVHHQGRSLLQGAHTWTYLLLTLGRERARDAKDPELPEAARGWVHMEDLCSMLRSTENALNIQIFRARRAFADAGIEDAARIIERRARSRQVRLGVSQFEIEQG